jgi:hypothetical protein
LVPDCGAGASGWLQILTPTGILQQGANVFQGVKPMSPAKPKVFFHHQFKKRRKPRKRRVAGPPPLTVPQILAWADAFHARTGRWPKARVVSW